MKKDLLGIIILLFFAGAWNSYGQPTAVVEFDQLRFCESGEVNMTVTFTGEAPYDFMYWIDNGIVDQGVKVTAHNSNTFNLKTNFTQSGYIRVYDLVDNNGVSGTVIPEIGNIIIDQLPTPTILDPIRTCDLNVHLSATKEFETSTVSWRLENTSDGILSDPSILNPVFTAGSGGSYNLYFTEVQGVCEVEISSGISVVNKPSPTGTIRTFTNDICAGEQSTIELDLTGVFPILVSYTDGDVEFSETALHQIKTKSLADDAVYQIFKLTDGDGCETVSSEEANITVDFVPISDAGLDINQCGNEVELGAVLNPNCYGQWIYEPASQYFSDASSATSLFTVPEHLQIAKEDFILTWKVTNENNASCVDENTMTVTLNKEPESIIISDIDKVYNAKEIELEAEPIVDGMNGQWIIVESPSSEPVVVEPDNNISLIENLHDGLYKFKWMVTNGDVCMPAESEISFENKGIFQTTGFSPNGDGVNETFIIGGAENVTNNKLVVFDVTGKVVYETKDFMNNKETLDGWDGKQNSGEVKDGTYYYIFEGDEIEPIKNYLIIKGSRQ